jgi:tubulin--tyrosine ligase-like protein 12
MRTYNLEKQLPEFIGEYYSRDEKGQDNLWILKPPNMARSLDMIITDNLSLIIKNM